MKTAALRSTSLKDVTEEGQESAARLWNQARESGEDLLYQLHRHVRRHPWKAVAVALGAGLVLGAVISRSGKG